MKTLISTDTSCLIDYESLKKYEISVFPLNVIVDGVEYLDSKTITQSELQMSMRGGKKIKTSTPPLGEVVEYFENLLKQGYDHIIHFTISSKLSSMFQLFTNVAKDNFSGKVTVIDSYGLSSTMLSSVLLAYEEAKMETKPKDIAKKMEARKTDNHIVFVPENLTALKNGGRISSTAAVIGNVLGIKPLINLVEGELKKNRMVKSTKRTFVEEVDNLITKFPPKDYDYSLVSFDASETTKEYIANYISEKLGENRLIQGLLPINVCAHCGPGTIGLVISRKINNKSLSDYIQQGV